MACTICDGSFEYNGVDLTPIPTLAASESESSFGISSSFSPGILEEIPKKTLTSFDIHGSRNMRINLEDSHEISLIAMCRILDVELPTFDKSTSESYLKDVYGFVMSLSKRLKRSEINYQSDDSDDSKHPISNLDLPPSSFETFRGDDSKRSTTSSRDGNTFRGCDSTTPTKDIHTTIFKESNTSLRESTPSREGTPFRDSTSFRDGIISDSSHSELRFGRISPSFGPITPELYSLSRNKSKIGFVVPPPPRTERKYPSSPALFPFGQGGSHNSPSQGLSLGEISSSLPPFSRSTGRELCSTGRELCLTEISSPLPPFSRSTPSSPSILPFPKSSMLSSPGGVQPVGDPNVKRRSHSSGPPKIEHITSDLIEKFLSERTLSASIPAHTGIPTHVSTHANTSANTGIPAQPIAIPRKRCDSLPDSLSRSYSPPKYTTRTKFYPPRPRYAPSEICEIEKPVPIRRDIPSVVSKIILNTSPYELEARSISTIANQILNSSKHFSHLRQETNILPQILDTILNMDKSGEIRLSLDKSRFGLVKPPDDGVTKNILPKEEVLKAIWQDQGENLNRVTSFKAAVNILVNSCSQLRAMEIDLRSEVATYVINYFIDKGMMR
jgi:hypothetical protein